MIRKWELQGSITSFIFGICSMIYLIVKMVINIVQDFSISTLLECFVFPLPITTIFLTGFIIGLIREIKELRK